MIEFPGSYSVNSIADWAEFYVIYERKILSKSMMLSLLQTVYCDLREEDIDSVISELIRRRSLYGETSPFDVKGQDITPKVKWKDRPELAMCLIFSLYGVQKERGKNDGTKLFERLSSEAIKLYLGGKSEVIGFPNQMNLEQQIHHICKRTCENVGHKSPKPTDKDKGVDIIAWKSHGDKRPNQIVLLLQCGAGANFSKKKPVCIKTWHDFVHWSARPIEGITIPQIISAEEFDDITDSYNLVFDRVRIFRAIYNRQLSDGTLRREIFTWCKKRLD